MHGIKLHTRIDTPYGPTLLSELLDRNEVDVCSGKPLESDKVERGTFTHVGTCPALLVSFDDGSALTVGPMQVFVKYGAIDSKFFLVRAKDLAPGDRLQEIAKFVRPVIGRKVKSIDEMASDYELYTAETASGWYHSNGILMKSDPK